ncbi:MAG: hypothetical protein ACE5EA_03645 [Nitrospirota bacterium]
MFGGLTPSGNIYIELFIQRNPTPQIIEHRVKPDGMLGEKIDEQGKKGIIREIESGLIMNMDVAKSFKDWLDNRIKKYETLINEL